MVKQQVPCFVLLKGIQGPFSIKGSFNYWVRAISLTQLGEGRCYFVKLDKQSFEYKYRSKNAIEPGYNREYHDNSRDKDPVIIDSCLGRNTPFYAGELLIALADVLHSGQQYIKDLDFLCRITRRIFDMAVAGQFVVDFSSHGLTEGIQFAIRVLVRYHQLPLLIDCLALFRSLLSHISTESLSLLFPVSTVLVLPQLFCHHHSILFPVFSALSGQSSFQPDFGFLSQHQHLLSRSLRSFKDQSPTSFLRLASSPFPKELSHQFCTQLIDVLPHSYLSLKVHDSLHEPILNRLQHDNNSLLLSKFLFRNWKDGLLSPDNFLKSIGLIIRQNPHALAFVATHLNNNAQFWELLKNFKHTKSVIQAIPVIVEFFKLDSKTQKVLIVILREFVQRGSVHNLFQTLVLGLPNIFNGWSQTPEIQQYLTRLFSNISFDCLESLIEPPLREAFIMQIPLSQALAYCKNVYNNIEETCVVGDILLLKEGTNFEKFIANFAPSWLLQVEDTVEESLRSRFTEIFSQIELFQLKLTDFVTIAEVFDLPDEFNSIHKLKDSLFVSTAKLSTVLANPISTVITQIVSAFLEGVQFDNKFPPETLVAKISSTALFRHFYTSYVNSSSNVMIELPAILLSDDEEGDIVEEDQEGDVPSGIDLVTVAATISQQILQFITQLLEPDVKASHLESVYSDFNEEEMFNEIEILSLLNPSGKLHEEDLFNIKSWVNRHVWDPIIACFQKASGLLSSIKISLADKKFNSIQELSSDSLLSDFGSYSKNFSSLIDCSHCNRTSPPLFLQIFQLLNNVDELLSILNKYSTLTPEELSSKLYGNFAASYTVNSSVAQFFISMLDDPKSLWNSVLKPVFHGGDVYMRQLIRNLHVWMEENCHSPQRVAADCKSINQLKSAIKAINELLGSDGDQSALINIISKCNFQEGTLLFNLETITVGLQLPTGEGSTIDVPEEEFHRARAEGILLQAESIENIEEQVDRKSGVDDEKEMNF
ncbi:hypothetical protein GEMRC1_002746 [Eukaryota sp. GEM-RC1]